MQEKPNLDIEKLTEDFVYGSLALSPVAATQTGYHEHNGTRLDEQFDDFSPSGIDSLHRFYSDFQHRLDALDEGALSLEERADVQIIQNAVNLALLDLQQIESHRHNPTVYVELIGNGLFAPFVLEYAPFDMRFQHIIARMSRIPDLIEQAKQNLADAPEIWNRIAHQENDGNIRLIDDTLRSKVPASLRADFDAGANAAIASLQSFSAYLKDELSKRTTDWRLGEERYAQKFAHTLAAGRTPEEVLAEAESSLKEVWEQMARFAAPRSISEALETIARQHTTPARYMDEASEGLAEATEFVRTHRLVSFPTRNNLQVIPTPEFMRGTFGVAGFNPAPALEPRLGAFYWVTPIPSDWPPERIESKLREYNRFGFMEITIHEAMPGHYVQFEVANTLEPKSRRSLRNIYGNMAYVEGWALYTQQMMSEEGFMNGSVELWLTFYKQLLRSIANAILDIRLQTMGMTDREALDLMINDTFQEREEATTKLQRAQLSSCQLPTYFVGLRAWLDTRAEYKKRKGAAFRLAEFHDAALRESAVPLPVLKQLLRV